MTDLLFTIGDLILLGCGIGASVFAISYAGFFQWRKNPAGRALMYFVISLIIVFVNNIAARLYPNYAFREWVRIVVYAAVFATIWRLVLVLWSNWGAGKNPLDLEPKPRKEQR